MNTGGKLNGGPCARFSISAFWIERNDRICMAHHPAGRFRCRVVAVAMKPDPTFDHLTTAAKTVWGEARGETQQGKLAVAWVIRNRWESSKWFGRGSVYDVCMRPWQFSCHNADDPNRPKMEALTLDDKMLQQCLYAVIAAFRGLEPDPTYGATHYYHQDIPRPNWAIGKPESCRIGHHVFFTNID